MEDSNIDSFTTLIKNIDDISGVKDCSKSKMYLRQWLTSINIVLVTVLVGLANGHSALLLQQLQPNTDNATNSRMIDNGELFGKTITTDSLEMQSWVASSMVLLMSPGCWILAACNEKIGRKPLMHVTVILFLVAWLLLAFARDVYQIIIGRSISGLCIGILAGLASVYLSECSIPKLRQTLNTLLGVAFSLGIGLCHAVGTWFHWRTTAIFCAGMSIIALIMNYQLPESPIWLVNQHKFDKAINSWTFLRGIRDLDELKSTYVKESRDLDKCDEEKDKNKYCSQSFWKPLGILVVIFTAAQSSGMGAVAFYSIQMMSDIAGPENAYYSTLILDTFRFCSALVLSLCTKKFSTRALTMFSAFSCSFVLITLSFSILYKIWAPWFALTLLFAYEATVMMGLGPLPWSFCSELFSVQTKEVGVGIVTNLNYILFFIVVKINPYLFVTFQPWGTFLFYGVLTLFFSIILFFILPNTKNKTLKEIELIFCNKNVA